MILESIDQPDPKSSHRFDVDLKTWRGVGHTLTTDTYADAKGLVERVWLPRLLEPSKP